jgi:fatty-acyl-CoA synthase
VGYYSVRAREIGAILVSINPSYRVHELEYALQQSGCSTLIIAPPFKTSNYSALLSALIPELERSQPGHLHAERVPELRTVVAFGPQRLAGAYHWEDVLALAETVSADMLTARQRDMEFDDPINIQYTSGTTGFPKGATVSHQSILNNAFKIGEYMRFSDRDRLCVTLPFYHAGGMVCSTVSLIACGRTAPTAALPVSRRGRISGTVRRLAHSARTPQLGAARVIAPRSLSLISRIRVHG